MNFLIQKTIYLRSIHNISHPNMPVKGVSKNIINIL